MNSWYEAFGGRNKEWTMRCFPSSHACVQSIHHVRGSRSAEMEWRKWYKQRKGVVDTKSTMSDIVCTSTTFPFLLFPRFSLLQTL
jgi:hypothetical protein